MRWYVMMLLLAATALSFWLVDRFSGRGERGAAGPRVPDYFLTDMERSTHDADGRVTNTLRADRLEHFADDDSIDLVQPRMEFYNAGDSSWFVQSETGRVTRDPYVVMLFGPVRIRRLTTEGVSRIDVDTSDLRVLPDERYAETDRPATITTPHGRTTAIGMWASLEHNRVQLREQVRSHYEISQ
jgi:lipopolysaccharide export system protein LptC